AVAESAAGESALTAAMVGARWSDLMQVLRRHHPVAEMYCAPGQPIGLDAEALVIGCEYPHNVKVLSDAPYRRAVEDAIFELFGQRQAVRFVHADGGRTAERDPLLEEAQTLFEAEIDA